jgi:hypothetical protein
MRYMSSKVFLLNRGIETKFLYMNHHPIHGDSWETQKWILGLGMDAVLSRYGSVLQEELYTML